MQSRQGRAGIPAGGEWRLRCRGCRGRHAVSRCASAGRGRVGKRCVWRAELRDGHRKDSDLWKGGFVELEEGSRRIQNPVTRPHVARRPHLPHPAPSATVVTSESERTMRYPHVPTPAPSSFWFIPQLLRSTFYPLHPRMCYCGFERTGEQPTENRGPPAKKFPPRQTHEGHDNANHLHPLCRRDRPHL